ncbi:DNA topoisomerase [Parabacteroides distasonis]|nr:DNA topoisomerase [Parabacteroides distasonis]
MIGSTTCSLRRTAVTGRTGSWGVNSSYAICKAVSFGNNSLGRVQTPVLAEICRRYRERENFLLADSWPVFVSLCKDRQIIKLRHTEDFQEYRYASELYGDCKAVRNARIATVSRETRTSGHRLPTT